MSSRVASSEEENKNVQVGDGVVCRYFTSRNVERVMHSSDNVYMSIGYFVHPFVFTFTLSLCTPGYVIDEVAFSLPLVFIQDPRPNFNNDIPHLQILAILILFQ